MVAEIIELLGNTEPHYRRDDYYEEFIFQGFDTIIMDKWFSDKLKDNGYIYFWIGKDLYFSRRYKNG